MAKIICPNFQDPNVVKDFEEIEGALFTEMAYLVWSKNNGNPIHLTKDGAISTLFEELVKKTNSRVSAIQAKAQMYLSDNIFDESKLDDNGEPTIDQFERFLPSKDTQTFLQNPIVNLTQKFKKPTYRANVIADGASKVVLEENGEAFYTEDYPKESNKRHVVNKFFRYSSKNGNTEPYYPFKVAQNWQINKDYIDHINGYYNQGVVGVENDGSIIFRPDIDNAKYIGNDDIFELKQIMTEEELAEQHLLDIESEIHSGKSQRDTKAIDEVSNRLNNTLKLLNKRASKTGGSPELKARITALKSKIRKLSDEKIKQDKSNILETMASEDAKFVKENLQTISENIDNIKDLTPDQILMLVDNLVENSYEIKGWIDIQNLISHTDEDLQKELQQVQGDYIELNKQYNNLLAELFTAYANKVSSKTDFVKDDFKKAVKDIGLVKSGLFNIGESSIELLEVVDDIISKSNSDIREESLLKNRELKQQEKKLKDAGISKKDVDKAFKQIHKDRWTGNIVGEVSHAYYEAKQEAYKAFGGNKKYLRWLRDNSKMLTLSDLNNIVKNKYDSAKKLGYSKEELDLQKELIDQYKQDKAAYREMLEMKYDAQGLVDEEMKYWELENSPSLYVQGQINSGSKYLIREKPLLSKWADKNFDKIKNNKALFDFYKFTKNRFDENNKYIGYFNSFQEFFLPEQQVGYLESIKAQPNVWKKAAYVSNSMKKAITEELEDVGSSKNKLKSVPIYMMQNTIPPAMKDSDIFKILNSHTDMSLNYKYKSEIEPMTNAATDLLNEMKDLNEEDKVGKKEPLTRAKRALEYAKDAHIYGKRKETEGRIKKVKIRDYGILDEDIEPKKNELRNKKKEQIKKAKTQKAKNEIEKKYEEQIKNVGKKEVEVTASALGDTLISYTYLKAMSLPNIVTPAVNMLFGINSNLIYASAGGDVNLANVRRAMLQMMGITTRSFGGKSNAPLASKVFAFMERFQLLGTIHDSDYGKQKTTADIITILQSKAEYFNQGSLMLGVLYTQKLTDKNGKEVSVFDAYKVEDGILEWDTAKMGIQSETPNNRIISEDKKGVNLVKFNKYIDKINATVHGDYKSAMLAKKSTALRLLMLFKTWLPKAVDHRFGAMRVDKDLINQDGTLGREVKGRYLTYYKSTTKEGIRSTFRETIQMIIKGIVTTKAFNKLSEVDRVNMIRNLKEIKQMATIVLTMAMLKGLFMDDDDEFKPILNLAINTLTKASADLSFFISPNSASQVMDNLISVSATLKDIERAGGAIFDLIQGDGSYEAGRNRGRSKLGVAAMRLIPGPSGYVKMGNLWNETYDY